MEANLGFPAENYVRDRCSRKVCIIIINENYEKVTWFLTSRKRRTHTHTLFMVRKPICLGGAQGIRQMPTHMFQYRPRLTSPAMLPHQSNSKFRVSVEQTSGDVRWLYNNRSHQLFSARSTAHRVCTRWVSFSIFFSPFFLAHIFLPILHGPNAHPGPSISFHEGWGQVISIMLPSRLMIILKHKCVMNIMLNSVESWRTTWFARHFGIDNVLNLLEALKELGELSGVTLVLTWGYIRQVLQRSVDATAAAGHPKAAEGCPKVTEKTAAAKRECSECLGTRNISRCYNILRTTGICICRFYIILII